MQIISGEHFHRSIIIFTGNAAAAAAATTRQNFYQWTSRCTQAVLGV
jgi:hypothetical protein